ncbi:MAG TPA: hypothetical protein VIF62_31825 [Labilithrix sp.]
MHRVIALAVVALVGCSEKPQTFETNVQIARTQVVTQHGTKIIDVELEYVDCPGEQQEIFQGDAPFANCIAKYKIGEKVPASVVWSKLPDGHYDSEVDRIGDCTNKRDENDDRSYEVVHECHDVVVNGSTVGFHCDRKPNAELLAKCPWFRRN